jgi:hypothetical protein
MRTSLPMRRASIHRLMPFVSVAVILLAVIVPVASGCGTAARRELSVSECKHGFDEDDDGLIDCDDPDCWAFDFCSASALRAELDAGAMDELDARVPRTDAKVTPEADTGTIEPSADSGPIEPCAQVTCETGFACNADGECESDYPMDLDVRMLRASVSIATAFSICWDTVCDGKVSIPSFGCICPPDTFVTVLVNGVAVGHSTAIEDKLEPVWPAIEAPIRVRLESVDDVVTFVVADLDIDPVMGETAEEIFYCTPSLESIKSATSLICTKEFFSISYVPPPKDGLFRVEASVERVRPE